MKENTKVELKKDVDVEQENNFDEVITYDLKKTVEYNGEKVEKIEFDFTEITGRDLMKIENEARAIIGKKNAAERMVVPALNQTYQVCVAGKACGKGSDFILNLKAKDYSYITMLVQDFLLGE